MNIPEINLILQADSDLYQALVVGLLICFALMWGFPILIANPIKKMLVRVNDINHGDGDLRARVGLSQKDDIGQLANCIDDFIENIQATITQVSAAVDEVFSNTEELSSQANESSRNIQGQHQTMGQVATSVNEMEAAVRGVSQSAEEAARAGEQGRGFAVVADDASEEYEKGIDDA